MVHCGCESTLHDSIRKGYIYSVSPLDYSASFNYLVFLRAGVLGLGSCFDLLFACLSPFFPSFAVSMGPVCSADNVALGSTAVVDYTEASSTSLESPKSFFYVQVSWF
jgi:hypothetical protein